MPSLYISASVAASMHIFICCGGICMPGMAMSICHSPALRGGNSSPRAGRAAAPTSSSAPSRWSPSPIHARLLERDAVATLGQDGPAEQLRCTIGHVEFAWQAVEPVARHDGPMRPDRGPSPRWPRAICPAPARIPQRHRAGAAGGRHPGAAGSPRPRGRQRRGRGTALSGRPRARRAGARDRAGRGTGGARATECRRQRLARSPLHGGRHRVAAGTRCHSTTPAPIRPITSMPARHRRTLRAAPQSVQRPGCWPLGNRTVRPVAAARHAYVHPVGGVAGGGDDGIRRRRLCTHHLVAAVGKAAAAGEIAVATWDQGKPRAASRAARIGAACARRLLHAEIDAILRGGAALDL